MNKSPFSVNPVTHYDKAQYPSSEDLIEKVENEEPAIKRPHFVIYFLSLLLVFGLVIGLSGCYSRSEYPGFGTRDCESSHLHCVDDFTLEFCEEGDLVQQNCQDYCYENFDEFSVTFGCSESAADPCQCDIVDGGAPMCTEDDIWCIDENTVSICNEYDYTRYYCNDYCADFYGADYYSFGCDESDENFCQCEYGIIDGEPAYCPGGDIICTDEETVGFCNGSEYVTQNCEEYCDEHFGTEYFSTGCDPEAVDPCLCIFEVP